VRFQFLPIPGLVRIDIDAHEDERGWFARVFDAQEFAEQGLATTFAEAGIATNVHRGTLRGMHLQLPPHGETKLVQCRRGTVFDVTVDLRPDSESFLHWYGVELGDSLSALHIPEGVAHGYVTMSDDSELEYWISTPYAPAAAVGVRWDDPELDIAWPIEPIVMSQRDRAFPSIDREQLAADGLEALRGADA
jgi:dTDP-4-dehydrorhamnose 3,5-epimerase